VEFLVQIQVDFPPDMPQELLADVLDREFRRGKELQQAGRILRIWRIPGRRANVGIWQGDDADAIHDAISSLPAFPWIDARVTPLATHQLEATAVTPAPLSPER
jgi:muconolactone D-isomerase